MIEKLERLIDAKGLTKKDFCDLIGVDSSYFSNWKKRGFPAARLPQAALALGLSLDDLTFGTDMASRFPSKSSEAIDIAEEAGSTYLVGEEIDSRARHLASLVSGGLRTGVIDESDLRLLEQLTQRMVKQR